MSTSRVKKFKAEKSHFYDSIDVFTDGSCLGNGTNESPGGWAFLIIADGSNSKKECTDMGFEMKTTNNIMELTAVINGLECIYSDHLRGENTKIRVVTDSKYVKDGIQKWIEKWKKNGWRTSKHMPVKNQALWKELDSLAGKMKITWDWVKAHSSGSKDMEFNNRVDKDARLQAGIAKANSKAVVSPSISLKLLK